MPTQSSNYKKAIPFAPLGCHSHFSFFRSTVRIPELVCRAKEMGLASIALADFNNLSGAVEFSVETAKTGIKPVYGMTTRIRLDQSQSNPTTLLSVRLYAATKAGIANLITLATLTARNGGELQWGDLEDCHGGLIMVAGNCSVWSEENPVKQRKIGADDFCFLQNLFGDRLYLELNSIPAVGQECLSSTINLAKRTGVRLVAVQTVRHLDQDDGALDDVLLEFAQHHNHRPVVTDNQGAAYFHSPEEICSRFAGMENAVTESFRLSERIEDDVLQQLFTESDRFRRIADEEAPSVEISRDSAAAFTESLKKRVGEERIIVPVRFGRLRARPLMFMAGEILGIPASELERLDNEVEFWIGRSFKEVLSHTPRMQQLADVDTRFQKLFAIIDKLDGIVRSAAADEFTISATTESAEQTCPLFPANDGRARVSQWDRKSLLRLGAQVADIFPLRRQNRRHG